MQYDLLVETTKTKKFIQHESVRAETEIEHAKDVVEDAAKAISAGIFQRADPESWVCSAKWCQFYSECRERRKGITVTLGMEEHG